MKESRNIRSLGLTVINFLCLTIELRDVSQRRKVVTLEDLV